MDYLSLVYAAYAAISVGLTIWLARTLSKSGQVFLEDVFADNIPLANAINRLLVVGFYLVNLGYASLLLEGGSADSPRQAIVELSSKVGALLLSLAVMHFMNMFVFHRIRRRALRARAAVPVVPQGIVPVPGAGVVA